MTRAEKPPISDIWFSSELEEVLDSNIGLKVPSRGSSTQPPEVQRTSPLRVVRHSVILGSYSNRINSGTFTHELTELITPGVAVKLSVQRIGKDEPFFSPSFLSVVSPSGIKEIRILDRPDQFKMIHVGREVISLDNSIDIGVAKQRIQEMFTSTPGITDVST